MPFTEISIYSVAVRPDLSREAPVSSAIANKEEPTSLVSLLRFGDVDHLVVRPAPCAQDHAPSLSRIVGMLTIKPERFPCRKLDLDEGKRADRLIDDYFRHAGQVGSDFGEVSSRARVLFKSRRRERSRG